MNIKGQWLHYMGINSFDDYKDVILHYMVINSFDDYKDVILLVLHLDVTLARRRVSNYKIHKTLLT